jgi:hypothetical protein
LRPTTIFFGARARLACCPAAACCFRERAGARLPGAIAVTHQLDRRLAALLAGKVDLVFAGHTCRGQVNAVIGVTHVSLGRLETWMVDGPPSSAPRQCSSPPVSACTPAVPRPTACAMIALGSIGR